MRELYLDDRGLDMTRAGESTAHGSGVGQSRRAADGAAGAAGADGAAQLSGDGAASDPQATAPGAAGLAGRHVCPFCGSVNDSGEGPCPRCTMENTADTRKATKTRIGPWYVLQSRNPAAPGMKYDTLLGFVRKGRVKARSIVRGPTTHQLWRFACQVKGLSREFGLCFSCGASIGAGARTCPQCNRPQDPPLDPDTFLEGQPGVTLPAAGGPSAAPSFSAAAGVQVAPPAAEPARAPVFRPVAVPSVTLQDDIVVPPLAGAGPPGPQPAPFPAPVAPAAPAPPTGAAAVSASPSTTPPSQPQSEFQSRPAASASSAPPPAGAAPASPQGRRHAGDVFLSAKDLAAAFQLDFTPDRDAKAAAPDGDSAHARSRPGVGVGRGAGDADAALPWPPRRRRKRRVGRSILLLLLLAVGGFAAFLAINAPARQRAYDWANAKYMALTGADLYPDISGQSTRPRATTGVTQPVAVNSKSDTSPKAASGQKTEAPAATRAAGQAPAAGPDNAAAPETITPRPSPFPPAPRPQVASSQPTQLRPPIGAGPLTRPSATRPSDVESATSRVPLPTTRPVRAAAPERPTVPRPAPPPPPRLTLQEAQQKSRALYLRAFDAEAKDDFAAAKRLYKQIMDELPKEIDGQEVWPSDVKLRYDQAVKILGDEK